MSSDLSDHDIAARAANKMAAEMGDGTVILDIETGFYYQLNATGARIWALLEEPLSIAALVDRLAMAFAVDRETCRAEVCEFVTTMHDKELLSVTRS